MTIAEILQKFEGVRTAGEGKWSARCPVHDDRKPSLSVGTGDRGTVLLKCQVGCETRAVLDAVGLQMRDLFPERDRDKPSRASPRARPSPPCRPQAPPSLGGEPCLERVGFATLEGAGWRSVARYPYRQADGSTIFEVIRFEPPPGQSAEKKTFRQRRPHGDGWRWGRDRAIGTTLYRLPELLKADASAPVFVTEGEKDADNVRGLGLVAVTSVGGAGGTRAWDDADLVKPLRGRDIVILADNDDPGIRHANEVARSLARLAHTVKVLRLPGLSAKGDVSDWIASGGSRGRLEELAESCSPWTPAGADAIDDIGEGEAPDRERPSQTQLLLDAAHVGAEYFNDEAGEPFVTLLRDGHTETLHMPSRSEQSIFRNLLIGRFHETHGRAASSASVSEAIETLRALTMNASIVRPVAFRVGEHAGRVFLDLGDSTWRVVQIGADGWEIVEAKDSAVRFRRSSTMRPLPEPVRGGSVDDLRRFLNTGPDEWRWHLMVSWLLFCFHPGGRFPPLVLQGEQGSAKSTTARVLRALIDPSQAELRMAPKDDDTLLIATRGSWVLAYDNLSGMPAWLSDALCCLATGTAFTKRTHYTNEGEHVIEAMRPVIVNGIDDMTARPDFASRAMAIELPPLADDLRREEQHFWAEFAAAQPHLLGALCSTVSEILAVRDGVQLASPPRMADFARWGVAAERVLGWKPGSFLAAYRESQEASAAVALEAELVALAMQKFMSALDLDEYRATATVLLPRLAAQLTDEQTRSRKWPINASKLGNDLRRLAPTLRQYGVDARQVKVHGERIWSLKKVKTNPKTASPPSPVHFSQELPGVVSVVQGAAPSRCRPLGCVVDGGMGAAGDGRVTAGNRADSRREGDSGDGGDATVSRQSEEEAEATSSPLPEVA